MNSTEPALSSALLDCKGKGQLRFITCCKTDGFDHIPRSSLVNGVGQRLLAFIKKGMSDLMKISSVGMGTWRKCLFGAVVLTMQTLSSLFRNIAYFISTDLLRFFFFSFVVLGKEPRFGFSGVWLPPDNLWCPPAHGRSHFRKVSENNSHDPFHGWKRPGVFIL